MTSVRVRFAPSPTGYLHIGGARTALFNWLFARKQGGQFILRIEDTDKERSSPKMVEAILAGLSWLGLDWDEGPYYQSERLNDYCRAVAKLLTANRAYPCFCSSESLTMKRDLVKSGAWKYDGICRQLSKEEAAQRILRGENHAVRLKLPPGETTFSDAVQGRVTFKHELLDDYIIQRTGGMPIYHLACVVDDVEMGITHVIRGADHLSNTPKQILLYQALDERVPIFAHVPLILGSDKKRLSKRYGATAVGAYKNDGFLPEAVRNFLALLGWSPGTDLEIFSLDHLIDVFSLEGIGKANAIFDTKKLEWINNQYLIRKPAQELFTDIVIRLKEKKLVDDAFINENRHWILKFIELIKPRLKTTGGVDEFADYFFGDNFDYDPKAVKKHWKGDVIERLSAILKVLKELDSWTEILLESYIRELAERMEISAAKLIHPVRVAITGKANSPGLFEMMELLGKEKVIGRLEQGVIWLEKNRKREDK